MRQTLSENYAITVFRLNNVSLLGSMTDNTIL